MLRIIDVNWLSKEAMEAEVTITDGIFILKCFSHPFNYDLNEIINVPLYCFDVNNVTKVKTGETTVNKLIDYFAYNISGELIDKNEAAVKVGEIIFFIENSELPGDLEKGDFISLTCKRIDLY